MNKQSHLKIERTTYDRNACEIGIVHLGFGAFHRAHQAVYFDDYMEKSGDLTWGIAAVNLRSEESATFEILKADKEGYLLKTTTPKGEKSFRIIRSHICFEDWSSDSRRAEDLLCLPSVKAVSMTVTESGYYLNDDWSLNKENPVIAAELRGEQKTSIYGYLAVALKRRVETIDEPITILCCDNIRSNGEKLGCNFRAYLELMGEVELAQWVDVNATFPNSMVDRITPRATEILRSEISMLSPDLAETAIHGESYIQWVLKNDFANNFPNLNKVGVEFVEDVDSYEEAKIRILNGGHTALCYLSALAGHQYFDEAMFDPQLRSHFDHFEEENVLPGLTSALPFNKFDYRDLIAARFSNSAIADDLGRICMDGWSKFPIFIRPTLRSCLVQGISPTWCYVSIASWYVYARRFATGQTHIPYVEPYWAELKPLLSHGQEATFANLDALWSDLPVKYDEFVPQICSAIDRMEAKWPV